MTRSEPSRPQALLFLAIGEEGYGQLRVWSALLRGLAERGHPITLAMIKGDYAPSWRAILPAGVEVISPPAMEIPAVEVGGLGKALALGRRVVSQLKLARWLRGELRTRAIHHVIVQSPLEVGLAGVAARGSVARVYWMMPNCVSDGYLLDLNRRLYRFLFNNLNVIPVANSRYTDSTLGAGKFRRHVLYLGINFDQFLPEQVLPLSRAALGIPQEVPLLGLFARMTEEKGHLVLAEALAAVDSDIHVLVCGGPTQGPFFERLRSRVDELSLAQRMHFQGPQSDIAPYYGVCDVILNTRLDPEPFGLSVIEAMAMRRPVLAHRAGGPGETVVDGVTGWLMDAPTPEAFAAGLRRMLDDRRRWHEMGLAAEAHARSTFSEPAMLDGLTAIIDADS